MLISKTLAISISIYPMSLLHIPSNYISPIQNEINTFLWKGGIVKFRNVMIQRFKRTRSRNSKEIFKINIDKENFINKQCKMEMFI